MGKFAKWKKILFTIILALVVIRVLYIGIWGEVDREYYTSTYYNLSEAEKLSCQNISETFICSQDVLNSLELIFCNIADDRTGAITLAVKKDENVIYQANISLSNVNNDEWKRIYVNIDTEKGKEYTISLNANEQCTQVPEVLLVTDGAGEITGAYQGEKKLNGAVAINFGYLRFPGRFDRLSVISLWVFFAMAVFVVLFRFEKIGSTIKGAYIQAARSVHPPVLAAVMEVLAGIIIINSSGIEFQEPTKVILYAISLLSVVKYEDKKKYIKNLADMPVKKIFLYLLYLYAAFALTGQRLLIYPLNIRLNTAGIFVFLTTVFWFVPVVNSLLYFLETSEKNVFAKNRRVGTLAFVLVCTTVLLLPALYNLFANNPGNSSPDTVGCMIGNAQHLHGMYDWHPAFYCIVLRVIQEISNTTYAVIAVQYFFWAYVMNELLLFLRKKNIKESILIGIAVFSGFNAGNFLHMNTIWKDIPYTLSLLWVFVILARLSIAQEEYKRKWYIYFEFIIAMIGVCLYRKNGMVTFALIAAATVIVFRKRAKILLSVVTTTALVLTIKGPVYEYFEVQDSGRHGIYIGLGQDILGAYYAGGEVSEETLAMITMMTAQNNAEYSYTPTWSSAAYDVDVTPVRFIKCYLDTFIRNPVLMIRAVIDREDALWDIFLGKDSHLGCVNYYGAMDDSEQWNAYYPRRHYVSLYTDMSAATSYTASSQWISAIEWRCGLFSLLGLIAVMFVFFKNTEKKHFVLLAPMIGHIMSLLLSTGWSDFRYFWVMNLLNMAFILTAFVLTRSDAEKKTEG